MNSADDDNVDFVEEEDDFRVDTLPKDIHVVLSEGDDDDEL